MRARVRIRTSATSTTLLARNADARAEAPPPQRREHSPSQYLTKPQRINNNMIDEQLDDIFLRSTIPKSTSFQRRFLLRTSNM